MKKRACIAAVWWCVSLLCFAVPSVLIAWPSMTATSLLSLLGYGLVALLATMVGIACFLMAWLIMSFPELIR